MTTHCCSLSHTERGAGTAEGAGFEGVAVGLGSAMSSAAIGRNSLVWWALGVRPYKDAAFSGRVQALPRLGLCGAHS